jgi:hypothetical protein
MPSRRSFLSTLTAVGSTVAGPRRRAPRVDATATIFFAHPEGERNLVRFVVTGTEDVAGRMRAYDQSGRLLGTAGVLGTEGRLFGELWMPVSQMTRFTSVLETPGSRTPVRTSHLLTPPRRWTLYWITVADPLDLATWLDRTATFGRAAALGVLQQSHAKGNPFQPSERPPELADHVAFLRCGTGARALEARYGIPASPIAIGESQALRSNAAALALAGAGVEYALLLDDPAGSLHTSRSRDGSMVITASPPPGNSPDALRFGAGGDIMTRAVEDWLTTSSVLQSPSYALNATVVVSTEVEASHAGMQLAVEEWNRRFAFPRIAIGGVEGFFREAERVATPRPLFSVSNPMPYREEPSLEALAAAKGNRQDDITHRINAVVEPINRALGSIREGLEGMAQRIEVPADGTLIFNPSPIGRTDLVTVREGREQLVTNVPGLGYVYLPDGALSTTDPYLEPGDAAISGQRFTVRLDLASGSVESLFQRDARREWANGRNGGINALAGATLARFTRIRLPAVGWRLIAERRSPWGDLRSTITVFDELRWVQIDNDIAAAPDAVVRYRFALPFSPSRVSWETPAGYEEQASPTGAFAHLRWIAVEADHDWRFMARGLDDPFARLESLESAGDSEAGCSLTSLTSGGVSRYRIDVSDPLDGLDQRWRFGWAGEPFVVQRAVRHEGIRIPSYGRLVSVDPAALVVGVKDADDGFGIIVFLQDMSGLSRTVRVASGILRFEFATRVDYAERDLDTLPVEDGTIHVGVRANGIAAVRLAQLSIDGG